MADLVSELESQGVLRTPRIRAALRSVPRRAFLPSALVDTADVNAPLPIGEGQTCSQPLTVALMLEWLQPQRGERVLDVGAGSGWTAALLATLVGASGCVLALERRPSLVAFARRHLTPFHFPQLELRCADGSQGAPKAGPFDVIHVAAASRHGPSARLRAQLAVGGRLLIPVGHPTQDLLLIRRTQRGDEEQRLPGFQFVPLIEPAYGQTSPHP